MTRSFNAQSSGPLKQQIAVIILTTILAGCGPALSSTQVESFNAADRRAGRGAGDTYFLPRAVMMARVIVSQSTGVRIVIDQPEIVADNGGPWIETPVELSAEQSSRCDSMLVTKSVSGPFTISHRVSGFHKDTITIKVDQYSLLKSVIAETIEQTTDFATNLGKSAGALGLEAGELKNEIEVFSAHFDPASCKDVAAIENLLTQAVNHSAVEKLVEWRDAVGAKSPFKKLNLENRIPARVVLSLNGFRPFRWPDGISTTAADCRVGVCVPVPTPASLVVSVKGQRRESPVIYIPNRSEAVAVPVSRSGFADVKTELTLDRGMLTERKITRDSEAVTIASLPAAVVGAYLDELSSGFKKRKLAVDDEIALAEAKAKRKKLEAGDLPSGPLIEMLVPGLSVGGTASPATLVNNSTEAPTQAGGKKKPKETAQGDGQAAEGGEQEVDDGANE